MYLCVLIENFRLLAALRLRELPVSAPAVLVDGDSRILELNTVALGRGVAQGMELAQAMGRCAGLEVLQVSAQAERAARRLLWGCAWRLTPQIELTAPGLATLELNNPDPAALAGRVDGLLEGLASGGLAARAGGAASPEWARLAALAAEPHRYKHLRDRARVRELLELLPPAAEEALDSRLSEVLAGWGITSLGAFARLPRQAVGERLGRAGLEAWDRLDGRTTRRLRVARLEPRYSERYELEDPVDSLEPVRFLLRRAAEALARELQQAGKAARTVRLELALERAPPHLRTVRLPETTCDPALLERLLLHHLEQVRFEAAITAVGLSVDPVDPRTRQAGLFQRSLRNPWRLAETLDQLAGLVGTGNFGSPRPADTHRPDVVRFEDLSPELPAVELAESGPPQMGPPLRRYRPAHAAEVSMDRGRPGRIDCDLVSGAIRAVQGPYRLSGDWWQPAPWAVEEWDVEIEGAGLFRLVRERGRWSVAGAYD